MKAYERLLNYVKVPTPSDERSGTHPSSACQRVLAEQLVKEMKKLGVSDVRIDEKCYVYGKIPATKGYESKTKLGFIAHLCDKFCKKHFKKQHHFSFPPRCNACSLTAHCRL